MKPAPKISSTDTAPATVRQGHDELNFAEFPLVLLANRAPAGLNSIEYQDDYTDVHGKVVTRKVTISGAGKYGLPTAQDEDVLIALMYLTLLDRQGFHPGGDQVAADPAASRTVHFTRPQLFQILNWPDTGDNYERLKKSLRRWKGVSIVYENWAFLTAQGERRRTDETGFSLLDNYVLSDSRSRPKEQASSPLLFADLPHQRSLCSITWNQTPFASFQTGYIKTLDLDRYFRLPTAAAKRAFRYLDKNLPAEGTQEYDLTRFATQHIGFSSNYKPSRLRQDVEETVVRPLEQAAFLAPLPTEQRFPRRDGRLQVVFSRASQAVLLPPAEPQRSTAEDTALLAKLQRHTLGGKAARDLLAAHDAAHVTAKIDYLDFLIEIGDQPKNPAGWLRRAIEQDFGAPAGYVPLAERHHQKETAAQGQRQQTDERAAARRREEQEAAARKAERAHIDAYVQALSSEERKALEEQAIVHADEALRNTVRQCGPLGDIARSLATDREVLRISPLPASLA